MADAFDGDFSRSRAVLMGTWSYDELSEVKAAEHSLNRMRSLLTSPVCGEWPEDRIEFVGDRDRLGELPHDLVVWFKDAQDVALFYYVGHGQLDENDRLCLAVRGSSADPVERTTTSLTFDAVRHAFHTCRARTKIAIVDCCFAGRAAEGGRLGRPESARADGFHLMMASGEYSAAWFECAPDVEKPQTYFTKAIADVVERGITGPEEALTLGPIFDAVAGELAHHGRPEPHCDASDYAADYRFARNRAFVAAPPPAHHVPWHNRLVGAIPGRADEFVTREVADELAAVLDSPDAAICTVLGTRGVGKSQLAAAYAQRVLAQEHQVGWIDARTPESIAAGLFAVAENGLLAVQGDSAKTVGNLRAHLVAHHEPRHLLVFDNATAPAHLQGWLGRIGTAKVLITSTNTEFRRHGQPVRVGTYTPAESVRFLANSTKLSDDAGARRVAEELAHLPLAIAVCAAAIKEHEYTYAEYLDRLSRQPMKSWLPEIEGGEYPYSVWNALCLSLDDTEAETGDPLQDAHTRAVLGLIAVLAPDGVDRDTLMVLLFGDTTSADARDRLDAVIARCVRLSAASKSEDTSMLRMHGLMRRAVRERAEAAGELPEFAERANALIRALRFDELEAWRRRVEGNRVISHIDGFWDTGVAGKCGLETVADALAHRAWATRQLTGALETERAVAYGKAVVADAERILGRTHRVTLGARHNLADAHLKNSSARSAIDLHKANLADYESALGPDDPATTASRDSLAEAYCDDEKFDKAISLHQENLRRRTDLFGPDDRRTLQSRSNLSVAYRKSRHKNLVGEMVPRYEADLADRERVLGADHPDTIESNANLAALFNMIRRRGDSMDLFESTLATAQRALGEDHPTTRLIRAGLASVYQENGREDDAVRLQEAAVASAEKALGADHRDTLQLRRDLATRYRRAGRTDVIPHYERELANCERVLGPGDPDTLTARNNLAVALGEFGQYDRAIQLFEDNVAARDRVHGADHGLSRFARMNLAWAYREADRTDDAIDVYETVVRQTERILGATHAETLDVRDDLAYAYRLAGRTDEAITILRSVVSFREATAGPDSHETMESRNRLAVTYVVARRFEDAIPLYEANLADRERVLEPGDPDTTLSRKNLADAYRRTGRFAVAIPLHEATVADLERSGNPDPADVFRAREDLAAAYRDAGKPGTAAEHFQALVADRTRVQGPEHRDTLTSRHQLAWCEGEAGDPAAAARRLAELIADRARFLGPDDDGVARARSGLVRWLSEVPELVVWLELLVAAHLVGRPSPNPDRKWLTELTARYPMDLLTSAINRRIHAAVDARHPKLTARFLPEDLAAHLIGRATGFLTGRGIVCDGAETSWLTPEYLNYGGILAHSIDALDANPDPSQRFLSATAWLNLTTTWPLIAFGVDALPVQDSTR